MTPLPPSPTYSSANESEFRRRVMEADGQNAKVNVAIQSLIFQDETDGASYRVSVVSGVLTVTAL